MRNSVQDGTKCKMQRQLLSRCSVQLVEYSLSPLPAPRVMLVPPPSGLYLTGILPRHIAGRIVETNHKAAQAAAALGKAAAEPAGGLQGGQTDALGGRAWTAHCGMRQ